MELKGKKVLVTGATGFIGSRLVEVLIEKYKCEISVLVRDFAKLPFIARFPVKIISGSLDDKIVIDKAVSGVDVIFNLAAAMGGTDEYLRKINVDALENLLEIAMQKKVRKVIHTSTLSVYGNPQSGIISEEIPGKYGAGCYGDSKLDGENLALSFAKEKSYPVVVIQPTIVYGPFSKMWTIGRINALRKTKVVLIDQGGGTCNAVYVDDLIQGMICAVLSENGNGERFLISGEKTSTWRDFWQSYEEMLQIKGEFVSMTLKEATHFFEETQRPLPFFSQLKNILSDQELRHKIRELTPIKIPYLFVKKFFPRKIADGLMNQIVEFPDLINSNCEIEKPLIPLHPDEATIYSGTATVSVEKAQKMINYQPIFDLQAGMKKTEAWAKWFGC